MPLVLLLFFGFLGFSLRIISLKNLILIYEEMNSWFSLCAKKKETMKPKLEKSKEKQKNQSQPWENPVKIQRKPKKTSFAMKCNTKPLRRIFLVCQKQPSNATQGQSGICEETPPDWLCVVFHCKICFFLFFFGFFLGFFSWLALVFVFGCFLFLNIIRNSFLLKSKTKIFQWNKTQRNREIQRKTTKPKATIEKQNGKNQNNKDLRRKEFLIFLVL